VFALASALDASAQVNRYAADEQRLAEQAMSQGRFPELKGITNSTADQLRVSQICRKYQGSDGTLCYRVAGIYQDQWRKQQSTQQSMPVKANGSPPHASLWAQAQADAQRASRPRGDVGPAPTRDSLQSEEARVAYDICVKGKSSQQEIAGCGWQASDETSAKTIIADAKRKAEQEAFDARAREADAERRRDKATVVDRLAACEGSNRQQIAMHEATKTVIEAVEAIQVSEDSLRSMQEVARTAGVMTAQRAKMMEDTAGLMALMKQNLPDEFAKYKALGGAASSPEQVELASDPCEALRPSGA